MAQKSNGHKQARSGWSRGWCFEFKKVAPPKYKVDIDAGELGKLNTDVEVSDDDIKLGDLTLATDEATAADDV
ncbi:MAG: hypothetical protein CM1200mP1_14080 [Candidatus Neomarinimicrobiota bacterium]|nr:MAG: hypothetical protein CM1200mP1_14080 [Candidatus Neomarinimicrobiota bacterium]